jgi:hypothetical protein
MSKLYKITFLCLALMVVVSLRSSAQSTTKYKCLIQMTNYMGDGSYIVISLIDPKGNYNKTLYVLGSDKKWYKTLKEWNAFYSKKPSNISAITGASVTGGDRSVNVIEVENSKINAGYKLRFESAVEDKKYNVKDLEIPLSTETLAAKSDGTGYIRFVRFAAAN